MAQVELSIGDRRFAVSCQDGEEDHLRALAKLVDEKARLSGQHSGMTESRMLLFAALLLADDIVSTPAEAQSAAVTTALADDATISALERLAERAEAMAAELEEKVKSA